MLKRKTSLKRGGSLKRSRLKPRNEERAAKRRAECFGPQAELCRQMMCCACSQAMPSAYGHAARFRLTGGWPPMLNMGSDIHHEPPRSIGGKDGDTVPLCRDHHTERHTIGRSAFERKHGVDLRAIAKAIRESVAKAAECRQDEGGR